MESVGQYVKITLVQTPAGIPDIDPFYRGNQLTLNRFSAAALDHSKKCRTETNIRYATRFLMPDRQRRVLGHGLYLFLKFRRQPL